MKFYKKQLKYVLYKIVLYMMTTFYCTVTCSFRDRNTDNLLLASAIVAIFTEMNSLDQ